MADLELAPLGLTHPRWTALWKLSRLGGHLSQKTLAEALEIELPSLMRTLGQLEELALIERHCCSQDKRARIVTLTPAGKVSKPRLETLAAVVRDVLGEAILAGGSTLKDFANADGGQGYFQHRFDAYGREGQTCLREGCAGAIQRIVQGGRSTFYCSTCQKK